MEHRKIVKVVDQLIAAEDLPARANLRVIRNSLFDGWSDEDIEAWFDHLHWYLAKEHAILLSIPKPPVERDFWPEPDDALAYSYGSTDYANIRGEFDIKGYKIRKVLERIKDLAETHSCISHDEGKRNIKTRYEEILSEFRLKALKLAKTLNAYRDWVNADAIRAQIDEQYKVINKAQSIWNKHAFER